MTRAAVAMGLAASLGWGAAVYAPGEIAPGRPDATVDLRTGEGVRLVQGSWRYSDVRLKEIGFRAPGPDLKPGGDAVRTYDYEPKAGGADFDDSGWEVLDPESLEARRGNGRLSFNWYRFSFTVPERIGGFDPAGSTVAFEIVVDDYAEIWVNGRLPRTLGQSGGALVRGWNAPNRVIVGRDVRPGQKIQLAVFAANGPLSDLPDNYIWIRSATLDFYRSAPKPYTEVPVEILRLDPALDDIVPPNVRLEKLADGFQFVEGPVWMPEGYLLFSDPNANRIYRWNPEGEVSVFRTKSGYSGTDIGEYGQPGSNGLTLDREGRLTICEHGNRRVTRLENNGLLTVLADRFEGRRLNSPNDLAYKSDGALYFTDPPFGLPRFHDDPRREQPHFGVYRYADGKLELISTDLTGPNGLAFSPGEEYLYVTNWDEKRKVVMRYPILPDGLAGKGEVFFDMTDAPGEEALDGIKVDRKGNLFVSGPGGVWVLSPEGRHLGMIRAPQLPANFAWGDEDGRTLYMTARSALYRIRLNHPGIRP
jgi:gluconolactonase